MSPSAKAAFLDRDGTLIVDRHFASDPAQVELVSGATQLLAVLRSAGFLLVVVTNQSGIARGLVSWPQYHAVAARLDQLLADGGATIDATYICPHHPDYSGPCQCRKPALELYLRAASDLGLDLPASIWIGDRLRDVQPGRQLGGRGYLVAGVDSPDALAARAEGIEVVPSLTELARHWPSP